MKYTLEQFDAFAAEVLDTLSDKGKDEHYGTDRDICEGFLNIARNSIFAEDMFRQREYELYLVLKAKFEPETPAGMKFQPGD